MKKAFKIGLMSLMLSLCFGSGFLASKNTEKVSVNNFQTRVQEPSEVAKIPNRGRVSRYAPTVTHDYDNTTGYSWNFGNSDPTDGQSTDAAVYSKAIKYGMSGFQNAPVFSLENHNETNTYGGNYVRAYTSSTTKQFLAQYIPFHITFNVPAHYKGVYTISYSLLAKRTNCSGGSADYSTELFYFGTTAQSHAEYFYHQDDFTATTGRGFSKYRVAGGNSSGGTASVTQQYVANMTLENHSANNANMNLYFGMFCYLESSGYSSNFEGRFTIDGAYYEDTDCATAVGGVNGTNVYSVSEAISAYNSSASSVLELYQNFDFTTAIAISSANGTIQLKGYSIGLGENYMRIDANTTINTGGGSGTQKITSSGSFATIAITKAATLTIDITEITNTSTAEGARAVLLGHANAKMIVGNGTTIRSNKIGVQIDDGTLCMQGMISSGGYAIHVGTSATANKNIYLYGSYCTVGSINTNNPAKTYIYASNEANSTSLNKSQTVTITGNYSLNDVVVRNVNSTNKSYFRVSQTGYALTLSGSNLIYSYGTYTVSYNLTGCTQTGGPDTASQTANINFTLAPSSGYRLPDTITINRAGSPLTVDTHYTYNKDTGAVCIYKEYLTNYINVIATAKQQVTLRFETPEGVEVHAPIVVDKNTYVTLPYPDTYPLYYSLAYWYENSTFQGTSYAPGVSTNATVNQTYYVRYDRTTIDLVDQFIGVQLHFDEDVISTSNVSDTGACRGDSGYYMVAKQVWNSFAKTYRELFCTKEGQRYDQARARLQAWANANGEELDLTTYQIVQQSNRTSTYRSSSDNTAVVVVTIVAIVSSITFACFFLLKKKRQQDK